MGCNCKKTAKAAKKYTDEETVDILTGVRKLLYFIRKILTVVLVIIVFIIATPFLVLAGIRNMVFGQNLKINISKIIKVFHVRN